MDYPSGFFFAFSTAVTLFHNGHHVAYGRFKMKIARHIGTRCACNITYENNETRIPQWCLAAVAPMVQLWV